MHACRLWICTQQVHFKDRWKDLFILIQWGLSDVSQDTHYLQDVSHCAACPVGAYKQIIAHFKLRGAAAAICKCSYLSLQV